MTRSAQLFLLSLFVCGCFVVAGHAQQAGQAPPVTFKVEVNYVEVDAVVVDARGNFVRDLTKEDFQVFEDGKPQQISMFSLVDIPVDRSDKPLFSSQAIQPDVKSNAPGIDGRIYLLVLDDLHTGAIRSVQVRKAARRFVESQMGANDLVAVVTTSGRSDAAQEFTNNRQLLLAAIDKFMGRKLRSPTLEKLDEYYRQGAVSATRAQQRGGSTVVDPLEAERAYNARMAFQDLKKLSDLLAGVRGRRKALIFISEGIDYDVFDVMKNNYASDIQAAVQDAISAAARANVNIYTIDPRGLTTMADESIQMADIPTDPSAGLSPQSLANEVRLSQDSLRVVADETGGIAAVNNNDIGKAFDRIVADNSSYYVLGYYPPNYKLDGKSHALSVKVNRPGVEVRARKGYATPTAKQVSKQRLVEDGTISADVREALESPLPVSGFTMSAFAAPFRGKAPNASVLLSMQASGRELKFAEKNGRFEDNIEVSVLAIDAEGKVRGGDKQKLALTLKPDTKAIVQQAGFRVLSRVEVPPGKYQLRIAGREAEGGRVGSVHYDLVVPDFSKEPLSMSGIVLTSRRAGNIPTIRPDQELEKLLPGPPTNARLFANDDELALFVEVYDNNPAQGHKVNITATVVSDDGRTVFRQSDERSSTELGGKNGGYGYTARIPLAPIPAGLYVLRIEAQSTLGRAEAVSRDLQFRVLARQAAAGK